MRKLIYILFFLQGFHLIAQDYHWDFAMSTGTCPDQSRTYPYDLNLINSFVLEPIQIELDDSGNAYVFGRFPTFAWSREYKINESLKIKAPQIVYNSAFYLYKLNSKGEVLWAHSISHENNTMEDNANPASMSINQFSGKIYLIFTAIDHFYIDENTIYTQVDNSKQFQKKMMVCLNNDGSYHKTIFSAGVLFKPVFSGINKGIYKASKISEFYPWDDSISFFLFDAVKDTAISYKYASGERILYFDKQQQVYRTDLLTEYNPDLVKTNAKLYNHSHLGSIVSINDIKEYRRAQNGTHYILYYNKDANTNNNENMYYLLKLDANYTRKWVHSLDFNASLQLDKYDNPWLFVNTGVRYKVDVVSEFKYYPVDENNPSDVSLIQLDSLTGLATNNKIVPTNMIQQTNSPGVFKLDQNNNFWIAGFMYNEIEFGNTKLSMSCQNNFLPLQHYVARAKEGWQQTRKNLGLEESTFNQNIQVYPNPANQYIIITSEDHSSITAVEVFDVIGKRFMLSNNIDGNKLNIEELPAGIYTLSVKTNNQYYTTKVIKL